MMGAWIPHPHVWGVVAEIDGRIVGSNFLDERDPIRGVGPITVDPEGQNAGVGRRLMEAVIERGKDASEHPPRSGRLSHALALALHVARLRRHRVLHPDEGKPRGGPAAASRCGRSTEDDLEECEALCTKVHGFARTGALRDAMQAFTPFGALRDGRIVAYALDARFWPMAYGVAETEEDMKALLLGAAAAGDEPIALLVPLQSGLFRWALEQGLRAVKPMNVMARGEYSEPSGSWFPSVIY